MPTDEINSKIILLLKASRNGLTWEELLNELKHDKKYAKLEKVDLEEILLSMRPQIVKSVKKDERAMFREYWKIA